MHAFIVFALIVSLQKIHGNKNVNFVKNVNDNGWQREPVQHPASTNNNRAYSSYDRSDDRFISAATDSESPLPTTPFTALHVKRSNTERWTIAINALIKTSKQFSSRFLCPLTFAVRLLHVEMKRHNLQLEADGQHNGGRRKNNTNNTRFRRSYAKRAIGHELPDTQLMPPMKFLRLYFCSMGYQNCLYDER